MAKSQLRVKQLCLLSIISSITNTNGNELWKTVRLTSFQNPQLQYVSSLSTRASLCICSVNTYTYHVLSSYLRKFAPTNQKHFPYLVLAVWNFCSRSPEVISRGNHRWCREIKCQLFSHTRTCSPVYRSRTTKTTTLFYCVNHNRSLCKHHHFVSLRRILVHHQNFLLRRTSINLNCSNTWLTWLNTPLKGRWRT